ncbi:MAG: hypothetical protein HY751_00110 [Nitrospinae bacterium]|nr:hypothetical protein [Nitrospinota bacterium]
MNPDLERLVNLQKLDAEIQRKSALLQSHPQQVKTLQAEIEAARQKLKDFDKAIEEEKKDKRKLEMEVESVKDHIAKAKSKLPAVKTNVEYRAVLKEIETFEHQISALDDKQLELMEKMESHGGSRKTVEEAVKVDEKRIGGQVAEIESAIGELKMTVDELQEKRGQLMAGIAPSILSSYERVLKARQGVGVTPVKDRLCNGCNQMIPPQLYYQVRYSDEIIQCPHCNRYLYCEPEAAEEKAPEKQVQ